MSSHAKAKERDRDKKPKAQSKTKGGVGGGFSKTVLPLNQVTRGPTKFAVFESKKAKPRQVWNTRGPNDDDICGSPMGDADDDSSAGDANQRGSGAVGSDPDLSKVPGGVDWSALDEDDMDFAQPLPGMEGGGGGDVSDDGNNPRLYRPGAGLRPRVPARAPAGSGPSEKAERRGAKPEDLPPTAQQGRGLSSGHPPSRAEWGSSNQQQVPTAPTRVLQRPQNKQGDEGGGEEEQEEESGEGEEEDTEEDEDEEEDEEEQQLSRPPKLPYPAPEDEVDDAPVASVPHFASSGVLLRGLGYPAAPPQSSGQTTSPAFLAELSDPRAPHTGPPPPAPAVPAQNLGYPAPAGDPQHPGLLHQRRPPPPPAGAVFDDAPLPRAAAGGAGPPGGKGGFGREGMG
eukprot:Hpha_TRINITY_DN29916_c0_g1::TRINITY_DN29916_c0_g1_i1::g.131783::m.131783